MAEENKPQEIEKTEEKKEEQEKPQIERKEEGWTEKKPVEQKPEERPKEDKKQEKQEEKKEEWKEFVIPLGKKHRKTVRYRKTPKAVKTVKEFILRHMKVYDRDSRKIKLDKYLNEFLWSRGIRNPPSKVKVKAMKDGENVKVELIELSGKFKFKKEKLERREQKAKPVEKKKSIETPAPEKTEEEKAEEKEKKAAVVEAGQKMEKAAAKQMKHQSKVSKQPKRQKRMALAK